ncbi:Failed axon connections-like [Lamellibrachia satsuma]|nr:Failed axon connections-like [Lamellibrachia satsuma]
MWSWTELRQLIEDTPPTYLAAGGVAIASTLFILHKKWCGKLLKQYPANTVILHQIGRGPWAPSMSPFPIKLETYLRMAEIPYQNEHAFEMSSKGKTPWITYNGVDVADTQFCIEYLNKQFSVDLNKDLSSVERSTARAFQKMTEEHLYWCGALWKWVYDTDWTFLKEAIPVSGFMLMLISWSVRKATHGQGLGRHSQEEVMTIGQADLKALSDFLGNKKFFMGDKPSEVDCAIFGLLAIIYWHLPRSPLEDYMKEELPNLGEYCETMKQTFWPDWEECITRGGTYTPTK